MATRKTTTTKTETKAEKKTPAKTTAAKVTAAKVSPKRSSRKTVEQSIEMPQEETVSGNPAFNVRQPSKKLIAIGATAIVLIGLLYLLGKYAVVAWVDNKPITRVKLYSMLDSRYGKDIREQLIVEQLILNEANNKNLSVNDDEIQSEIKKIEEQQGGADQLNQILQVQGISQDEFHNLIKLQLLRTKIFGEGVNVTEQQANEYIEQNKESLPAATAGATPADKEKLKADVLDQLKQQQISTKFNEWLQTTLQSERVKRN